MREDTRGTLVGEMLVYDNNDLLVNETHGQFLRSRLGELPKGKTYKPSVFSFTMSLEGVTEADFRGEVIERYRGSDVLFISQLYQESAQAQENLSNEKRWRATGVAYTIVEKVEDPETPF